MKKHIRRRTISFISAAAMLLTAASSLPAGMTYAVDIQEPYVYELPVCVPNAPDELYTTIVDDSYVFENNFYDQLDERSKTYYDTFYDLYKDGIDTEKHLIDEYFVSDCLYKRGEDNYSVATDETKQKIGFSSRCADAKHAFEALVADHPELYWLRTNTDQYYRGSNQISNYNYLPDNYFTADTSVKIYFEVQSKNTADEPSINGTAKDVMESAVANAVEAIDKELNGVTDSPYLTIKAIHDYLCKTIAYNNKAAAGEYTEKGQSDMYQSAYSAFYPCNDDEEIMTVCAGYARGFEVLCNYYGIPCVFAASNDHAWNYVKINSVWYGVDCTWDDQGDHLLYDCFLAGAETKPTRLSNKAPFGQAHVPNQYTVNGALFAYPEISQSKFDETKRSVNLRSSTDDNGIISIAKLSVSGTNSFYEGDTVAVTAEPVENYKFVGWYETGSDGNYTGEKLSADAEYKFVMGKTAPKLTAVYKPVKKMSINFGGGKYTLSINDSAPQEFSTEQTRYFEVGDVITVTAEDDNFAYWMNKNNSIISRSASYTFKVTNDMSLNAVYDSCNGEQAIVNFVSAYNQVKGRVVGSAVAENDIPAAPAKLNSVFKGWSINGKYFENIVKAVNDAIQSCISSGTSNSVITVRPVYEAIETKANIQVTNGTGGGDYKLNDLVTVTADTPADGMKFSHWIDDKNNILSYNSTYSFYALNDTAVEAVYVNDSAAVNAVGLAMIDGNKVILDKTNKTMTVVGKFSVPEGCTMETAGIIATSNAAVAAGIFDETTGHLTAQNTGSVDSYRFDRIVRISEGNENRVNYFRAYMAYSDAEGEIHTIYGDIVSAALND